MWLFWGNSVSRNWCTAQVATCYMLRKRAGYTNETNRKENERGKASKTAFLLTAFVVKTKK